MKKYVRKKFDFTKEYLETEYATKNFGLVAKESGVSKYILDRLFTEFNISKRPAGEEKSLANNIRFKDPKLRERYSQMSKDKNNPRYIDGRCCTYNYCKCGKKLTKWLRSKRCVKCRAIEDNPFKGKHHTAEVLKIIGEKSKAKWTPEYKTNMRFINETKGLIRPLEEIDEYDLYFDEASFYPECFAFLSDIDKQRIKTIKLYNSSTNKHGLVRDHMYSRYSGFKNKISALLLRHPCNCQIITNIENIKKAKRSTVRYGDSDDITLKQLVTRIYNFKRTYSEQEQCIKLIKENYMNLVQSLSQEGSNVVISGGIQ